MRLRGFVALVPLVASVTLGSPAAQASPQPGDVYVVGPAARSAALSFWTPARIVTATAAAAPRQPPPLGPVFPAGALAPQLAAAAPRGIPSPVSFGGVPTVGALFYTKGGGKHFCTASVVSSRHRDLILTAAHCVYSSGRYSQNIEFVPGYHDGAAPYGSWPVAKIVVAKGWRQRHDPSLDYAYLEVAAPRNAAGSIQDVTGALNLDFYLHDAQRITVIGYNDTDQHPIRCATRSFKFSNSQMEFYCRNFWYGTSGGPWIIHYRGDNGTGTVFGVIGGYQDGGNQSWASYSPIFWQSAQALFRQAEAAAAGAARSSLSAA
jgi:V8-like Glu-specific endopeptidase